MKPKARTPQAFREFANQCDQLAANATSPYAAETLRYIASRWRALADEDERNKYTPRRDDSQHPSE